MFFASTDRFPPQTLPPPVDLLAFDLDGNGRMMHAPAEGRNHDQIVVSAHS